MFPYIVSVWSAERPYRRISWSTVIWLSNFSRTRWPPLWRYGVLLLVLHCPFRGQSYEKQQKILKLCPAIVNRVVREEDTVDENESERRSIWNDDRICKHEEQRWWLTEKWEQTMKDEGHTEWAQCGRQTTEMVLDESRKVVMEIVYACAQLQYS